MSFVATCTFFFFGHQHGFIPDLFSGSFFFHLHETGGLSRLLASPLCCQGSSSCRRRRRRLLSISRERWIPPPAQPSGPTGVSPAALSDSADNRRNGRRVDGWKGRRVKATAGVRRSADPGSGGKWRGRGMFSFIRFRCDCRESALTERKPAQ